MQGPLSITCQPVHYLLLPTGTWLGGFSGDLDGEPGTLALGRYPSSHTVAWADTRVQPSLWAGLGLPLAGQAVGRDCSLVIFLG